MYASEQVQASQRGAGASLAWGWLMGVAVCDLCIVKQAEERKGKLAKRLEKIMLRRTKEAKLANQLPKKLDFICVCRLSDLQYRAYMCGTT